MKILYVLTVMSVVGTSWRFSGIAAFDLMSICFLALSVVLAPRLFGRTLYRTRYLWIAIALIFTGLVASFFQTIDASAHFSRGMTLLVTIATMWMFAAAAADLPLFKSVSILIFALTAGSASVVFDGLLNRPALINDITRQVGWMEHSGEAGYVAAFGLVAASWLWIKTRSLIALFAALINLASLLFSASMTGLFSGAAGLVALSLMNRLVKPIIVVGTCAALAVVFVPGVQDSFFVRRLMDALAAGAGYTTIDSRLSQIDQAYALVLSDVSTFLTGHGYAPDDIVAVGSLEVHNTPLAAIYHLGVFGLLGYAILFGHIIKPAIDRRITASDRSLLVGMLVIFVAAVLTSPGMSRRTLWVPVIIVAFSVAKQALQKPKAHKSGATAVTVSTTRTTEAAE